MLANLGANCIGLVVNGVGAQSGYGSQYTYGAYRAGYSYNGYGYGYGEERPDEADDTACVTIPIRTHSVDGRAA